MANAVLTKIFGDPQAKILKRLQKKVAAIAAFEDAMIKLSDAELREKTEEFKKRLADGKETLDDILPEAFAVVREASKRVLGMRHFDVQMIGGMAMHEGNVAEMKTGEGKTLVATLPMYLNGLEGKGAHLVTVNEYLAKRDAGWMGELYHFLGLSLGIIAPNESFIYDPEYTDDSHDDERLHHLRPTIREEVYKTDLTYGTNNEYGFDYLRDNMVRQEEDLKQRELHFAIVDEVDSILIDEARTPLIISAPASSSGSSYSTFSNIARRLTEDDYEIDEKRRTAALKDEGVAKVQEWLGIDNLYAPENVRSIYHLDQALRAETLFKREKDYVIADDGEIVIVDEFTGRLLHGRRYSEGLHQAIEAKEGVEVQQESMTLATISFQNYFRLYTKLAGMTGTAFTEAEEFQQIYDLDVVVIPTNRPIARDDKADRIYKTAQGKFKALVETTKELQEKGQPVLIGTSSIEKNDLVSSLLREAGVTHNVLNAKNNESEAAIVAKAGEVGAVTLATNIAGRGTDIKLSDEAKELGGLYVIGSERHESRRIDNQLRGRAGRQGDPGTTQFYVSAEDDLMRIFGGDRLSGLMNRLGVDETMPIENKTLSKALEGAQKKVESHNFDSRKNVVSYDDVMNRHRKAIYRRRKRILTSEDISEVIGDMIEQEAAAYAPNASDDIKELAKDSSVLFGIEKKAEEAMAKTSGDEFVAELTKQAQKRYKAQEKAFGENMRRVEREVHLQILDTLWIQHLENMGHLREGINWRSVGQKDPLVEYRREGKRLFEEIQQQMQREVLQAIFHAAPAAASNEPTETELTRAAEQAESLKAQADRKRQKEAKSSKAKTATPKKAANLSSRPSKKKSAKKARKKR